MTCRLRGHAKLSPCRRDDRHRKLVHSDTTDTAELASQEVQQLKAEVVELKTENEELMAKPVKLTRGSSAPTEQRLDAHNVTLCALSFALCARAKLGICY